MRFFLFLTWHVNKPKSIKNLEPWDVTLSKNRSRRAGFDWNGPRPPNWAKSLFFLPPVQKNHPPKIRNYAKSLTRSKISEILELGHSVYGFWTASPETFDWEGRKYWVSGKKSGKNWNCYQIFVQTSAPARGGCGIVLFFNPFLYFLKGPGGSVLATTVITTQARG